MRKLTPCLDATVITDLRSLIAEPFIVRSLQTITTYEREVESLGEDTSSNGEEKLDQAVRLVSIGKPSGLYHTRRMPRLIHDSGTFVLFSSPASFYQSFVPIPSSHQLLRIPNRSRKASLWNSQHLRSNIPSLSRPTIFTGCLYYLVALMDWKQDQVDPWHNLHRSRS